MTTAEWASAETAEVVLLPLPQLLARPFAALVLPGCDEKRLPASPDLPGLWTAAQRTLLGLPNRTQAQQAQRSAWQHLLQTPQLDVLLSHHEDNAAVLLVDHQTGLLSLVRDIDPDKFKNNVLALADMAEYFKLPTILTTSFENGPNGPLVPELKAKFPTAPYIARPGQINAWDNEDFVKAVKATGKKQLIIAGTITSVCLAFPSISAVHAGYQVFAVIDASGTYSKMAEEITLARIVQAGVVPMDTAAVASELQQTWNRPDAAEWAEVYTKIFPAYQLLIESYGKAQDVVKNHEVLDFY